MGTNKSKRSLITYGDALRSNSPLYIMGIDHGLSGRVCFEYERLPDRNDQITYLEGYYQGEKLWANEVISRHSEPNIMELAVNSTRRINFSELGLLL